VRFLQILHMKREISLEPERTCPSVHEDNPDHFKLFRLRTQNRHNLRIE